MFLKMFAITYDYWYNYGLKNVLFKGKNEAILSKGRILMSPLSRYSGNIDTIIHFYNDEYCVLSLLNNVIDISWLVGENKFS